jgi:uncharacterized delta-60 repeat protein
MTMTMLDRSFGAGGGVFLSIPGARPRAVAIDATGRITIAGNLVHGGHRESHIVLARLTEAGSLDRTFGSRGIVELHQYSGCQCSDTLLLNPDGSAYLTATAPGPAPASWLVHLDPSGNVVDGRRRALGEPHEGSPRHWLSLTVLADAGDGTLVAAGAAGNGEEDDRNFAIARMDLGGNLDPSFGHGGVTTTDFAGRQFDVSCVHVGADSQVLTVGTATDCRRGDPAILRYLGNGQLDSSFGTGGLCAGNFGGEDDRVLAAQVLPSGRILIAGSSRSRTGARPAFAAYRADGVLDTGFGSHGRGPDEAPELRGAFTSAGFDATGNVVLAGRIARGQVDGVALTRLTARGRLDPASGVGGVVLTQLRAQGSAVDLASHPSGGIVVVAETETADGFVALRYLLPPAGSMTPAGVPYLVRADLEDRQDRLMQRIQHEREMNAMITRGIW